MTTVSVFVLTPDAQKAACISAIWHLTPDYGTIGFARKVAPKTPAPTWETAPTHWRTHDSAMSQAYAMIWQAVATDHALPGDFEMPPEATMTEQEIIDAMDGVRVVIGNDIDDSNAWAAANMSSSDLMDVPNPPL